MQVDAAGLAEFRKGRLSQSLINGLTLLRCFSAERPSRGIADLAEELGMGRSTTHRYATTLVELGFLERDRQRRYRLGLRGADVALSLLGSMRLRALASAHLEGLREQTRCMVAMAVLDGPDALCVLRLVSHRAGWRSAEEAVYVGARAPAHTSPLGRALIALEPSALQVGREGGPGSRLRSLAAPVLDEHGQTLAAVGLLAPPFAYSARELALRFEVELLQAVDGVASALARAQASSATIVPAATASRSAS